MHDWNSVLVEQVFLGIETASNIITRMDATARFLARCTGDIGSSPLEAQKSFIASFGQSPNRIRSLYRWSSHKELPKGKNIPICFAALYLTLLAGSADESTGEIGDFRQRFSELLSPVDVGSLPFEDLPEMWQYVASWSKARHETLADCSVLKLPENIGFEKRIGISKQLAFPTFKDEIKLRRILDLEGLSDSSEFVQVARAVQRRASDFSPEFRSEFTHFSSYVRKADFQRAYESRFWGVVRDVTLIVASDSSIESGNYCLRLNNEDQFNLGAILLFDDGARKCLPSTLKSRQTWISNLLVNVAVCDLNGYPTLGEISLAFSNSWASKSKIGRGFAVGWHTLLPDSLGYLTTDGSFYDQGPVAFIVKTEYVWSIRETLSSLKVKFFEHSSLERLSNWTVFQIESITRPSIVKIIGIAPTGTARFSKLGWSPPRIRITRGSWSADALLLNPASNPLAFVEGAVKGTFRLFGATGQELHRSELLQLENGFQADPKKLVSIPKEASYCEHILETDTGCEFRSRSILLGELLTSATILPNRLTDWLVEGARGCFQPADFLEKVNDKPDIQSLTGLPSDKFPPRFTDERVTEGPKWYLTSVDDLSPLLRWLCDALLLRFESRATMDYRILNEYLDGASAASGLPLWLLRRMLVEGQWLRRLLSRGAPYPVFAPSPRLIVVISDEPCRARLSGMLNSADLTTLQEAITKDETAMRLTAGELSIGVIELELESSSRVAAIAKLLNATVVNNNGPQIPLAALTPEGTQFRVCPEPVKTASMEIWFSDQRRWTREGGFLECWHLGEIRRMRSHTTSPYWYWVKVDEDFFLRTDDPAWCWLIAEAASQRVCAYRLADNSIRWTEKLISLPISVTQWWLLFGGGCITFTSSGNTLFTGSARGEFVERLGLQDAAPSNFDTRRNICQERRELAIRLYKSALRHTGRYRI